jgi:hypothetical protein
MKTKIITLKSVPKAINPEHKPESQNCARNIDFHASTQLRMIADRLENLENQLYDIYEIDGEKLDYGMQQAIVGVSGLMTYYSNHLIELATAIEGDAGIKPQKVER